MSKFFSNRRKVLIFVILLLVLSTAAYGFAASVDMSAVSVNVGEGSASVGGYTVTNFVYTLDASDPRYLDTITFDLSPAAAVVWLGLDDADPTTVDSWISCTPSGVAVTCTLAASTYNVEPIDTVYVVAHD
jgi:hypothetical protein